MVAAAAIAIGNGLAFVCLRSHEPRREVQLARASADDAEIPINLENGAASRMTRIDHTRMHTTTAGANSPRRPAPSAARRSGLAYDGVTTAYIRDISRRRGSDAVTPVKADRNVDQ